MKNETILVIPAEGDSPETEQWYVRKLEATYKEARVLVFDNTVVASRNWRDLEGRMQRKVYAFLQSYPREYGKMEIHAQGGFGAYVATLFMGYPEFVERVFFVGGAPCIAMTWIAKFFHRSFVKLWYCLPIPFFADDPNPTNDAEIKEIKASSTKFMRANPLLYRNQLLWIGHWAPEYRWRANCPAYFVPNGDVVKAPKWWDNTYNNELATKVWEQYGVAVLEKPGQNFSFYSMMPAKAFFVIRDNAIVGSRGTNHE